MRCINATFFFFSQSREGHDLPCNTLTKILGKYKLSFYFPPIQPLSTATSFCQSRVFTTFHTTSLSYYNNSRDLHYTSIQSINTFITCNRRHCYAHMVLAISHCTSCAHVDTTCPAPSARVLKISKMVKFTLTLAMVKER